MNNLQKLFNQNMKEALILEIAELETEINNPRSKPAKNKQRSLAITQKKQAIEQIEEFLK